MAGEDVIGDPVRDALHAEQLHATSAVSTVAVSMVTASRSEAARRAGQRPRWRPSHMTWLVADQWSSPKLAWCVQNPAAASNPHDAQCVCGGSTSRWQTVQ